MTTKISETRPIEVTAGIKPLTEGTKLTSAQSVLSDKIRFFNGFPQKIGGWTSFTFDDSKTISGIARSIFSYIKTGLTKYTIGTHKNLYSLSGSELVNITPLKTSSTAIANSLNTMYDTLANNPITTVNASNEITIADTKADRFISGDLVTLSGSASVNGIPDTEINAQHIIRSIGVNSYTIKVSSSATSSGSGGGAAVVRASGIIRVDSTANALENDDRVKIASAADTGGITAVQINLEFNVRNVATDTFDIATEGTATSSVSGGGGASTVYYEQVEDGFADEQGGVGYGVGKYGVGLYGTALTSNTIRTNVTTWFFDKFGDIVITTRGNQTPVYEWDSNNAIAPVAVANAPTSVNYAFVSNNILVTLGASDTENKIFASDQGDRTQWTSSSTNQVFEDNIEGAGRFLSHAPVAGLNLLFTEQKTYTFRYIGLPLIWEIKEKDSTIGIISPMARVVVGGIAYWLGTNNFYMWRSGRIEIIPSNIGLQSTILKYVFDDINRSQASKIYAWYNEKFNEIWWHYPSSGSNEIDRIARLGLNDFTWSIDTMDRTGAEYPNTTGDYPRLISSSGILYKHESGNDDDGSPMPWSIETKYMLSGKDTYNITGIIPDNLQTGNISLRVESFKYPQSTNTIYDKTYTISNTTERLPVTINGRFWSYTLSGNSLGQNWTMGQWYEEVQKGARN